jgi:hypothetical protein
MFTITDKPVAQGDCLIIPVSEIPTDAVLSQEPVDGKFILAHSETGHCHVVKANSDVRFYQHANDNNLAYLVVDNTAVVEHMRSFDTHAPLQFSKGIYEIRRQIESSPEGFRRAID